MGSSTKQLVRDKMFVDPDTGECISGLAIYEAVSCEVVPQNRFEWLKLYPHVLPILQRILKSKSFDVVAYCLSITRYGSNEFRGSRTEISKETGVGTATVNRVFEGLLSTDMIRPVGGSTWMVNPKVVHGGNQSMDRMLEIKYSRLRPNDKAVKAMLGGDKSEDLSEFEELIEELIKDGGRHDDN